MVLVSDAALINSGSSEVVVMPCRARVGVPACISSSLLIHILASLYCNQQQIVIIMFGFSSFFFSPLNKSYDKKNEKKYEKTSK